MGFDQSERTQGPIYILKCHMTSSSTNQNVQFLNSPLEIILKWNNIPVFPLFFGVHASLKVHVHTKKIQVTCGIFHATSFPGSLILPPGASTPGGKMRDPGNVTRHKCLN